MSNSWFYAKSGAKCGPVEVSVLQELLASGSLPGDTAVWSRSLKLWTPAKDVSEFAGKCTHASTSNVTGQPKTPMLRSNERMKAATVGLIIAGIVFMGILIIVLFAIQ